VRIAGSIWPREPKSRTAAVAMLQHFGGPAVCNDGDSIRETALLRTEALMHLKSRNTSATRKVPVKRPNLEVVKLGIVSRDYRKQFPNGHRDFSFALGRVLKLLDNEACDAALFSLFSIIPRQGFSVLRALKPLKRLKAVFLEEFTDDGARREPTRFVMYYRSGRTWREYEIKQKFGSLQKCKPACVEKFVASEMPRRMLGNSCILLCGETNGVKYSPADRAVDDVFGLRKSIPNEVNVVLNPVHDRMTRFEMPLKRKYLSESNRWVISVWNKGKEDGSGKTRDGRCPAWTVFHNGTEVSVDQIENSFNLEVGILDFQECD